VVLLNTVVALEPNATRGQRFDCLTDVVDLDGCPRT